jgi:predicted nucleotidyltransferase
MPAGSSNSFVHTWPSREVVDAAAREWAERVSRERGDVAAVGYVGSYARGDWGHGSDLDLIVIVDGDLPPVGERGRAWDTASLPVPTDLILYSQDEWRNHLDRSPRWRRTVANEAVWLLGNPAVPLSADD